MRCLHTSLALCSSYSILAKKTEKNKNKTMASKSKVSFVGLGFLFFTFVALVLLFSLAIIQEHSVAAGTENIGCYYGELDLQGRKLLSDKQEPARTGGLLHAITSGDENMVVGGSELRVVPSGPDPLHHNGSPKKPRTP